MKGHFVALLSALFLPVSTTAVLAQKACPGGNSSVPSGANTTDPNAPFYIDISGLDMSTSPPTRKPSDPAYPAAKELADGQLPTPAMDGDFIIGPTHAPANETMPKADAPKGSVFSLTMSSNKGVIYNPAMVREDPANCLNASVFNAPTAPGDKSDLIVTTSRPGVSTRGVDVYVPAQYAKGAEAPFLVFGDGGPNGFFKEQLLFTTLDNLIAEHRIPPMIAISVGAGGQDAQGSERGLEYDAVSGDYAQWIESEVLPLVEQHGVKLTKNPDGRATMGISSSGAAAFTMAWFRPDLYHRVLAYSPTMVNQQWPHNTALPGGAWEYHSRWAGSPHATHEVNGINVTTTDGPDGSPLIPNSPVKPIRFWFETGDQDLFYPLAPLADGMHDWVLADERMAKVLADKGYHYQFLFSRNAKHVDGPTVAQTLPEALEWLWQGYKAE